MLSGVLILLWLLPQPLNFALPFSLFHILNIIFIENCFKEYIFRSLLFPKIVFICPPTCNSEYECIGWQLLPKKTHQKLVTWKIIIYVAHNSTVCQFEPSSAEKFSSSRMVSLMPPWSAARLARGWHHLKRFGPHVDPHLTAGCGHGSWVGFQERAQKHACKAP